MLIKHVTVTIDTISMLQKQGKEQEELLDQLDSSKETPIPLPSMVITKSPI